MSELEKMLIDRGYAAVLRELAEIAARDRSARLEAGVVAPIDLADLATLEGFLIQSTKVGERIDTLPRPKEASNE
jgi:hypothetical protein